MIRRLLGGRGAGPYTPTYSAFTIAAAPDGYSNVLTDPRAMHYNGKTYMSWVDGSGNATAARWDNAARILTSFDLAAIGADVHNGPAILVREPDKRILASWSAHDGPVIYTRISTNAEDVSAWGATSSMGAGDYTYQTLVQLRSVASQPIYMFYRNYATVGRLAYRVSTDGGATWGSEVLLLSVTGAGNVPYWKITTDWLTRIDIAVTDTDRSTANPSSLYHFYIDGTTGNRYKTDGTQITAALPIAASDTTLVKSNAEGPVAPESITYDVLARPVIVYQVYSSAGVTNSVRQARWTSAWGHATICDTNGLPTASNFRFEAGAVMLTANDCIIGRKVSGHMEMFRYTSTDDGATWSSGTQLTTTATGDALLPAAVVEGANTLRAIWTSGTLTNSTTHSMATIGYGTG